MPFFEFHDIKLLMNGIVYNDLDIDVNATCNKCPDGFGQAVLSSVMNVSATFLINCERVCPRLQ